MLKSTLSCIGIVMATRADGGDDKIVIRVKKIKLPLWLYYILQHERLVPIFMQVFMRVHV